MSQSYFEVQFNKWLMGEIRTDGWISGWRVEQERRRKEEMGKRIFVRAPQIKERQRRRPGPRNARPRECDVCGRGIRRENKTGRCGDHPLDRRLPMNPDYKCGACDQPIRKTEFGVCKRCFIRYRRLIEQKEVRVCAELGCSYSLNKNTIYTKCRKHSRKDRTARETLRQRMKRIELKRAA